MTTIEQTNAGGEPLSARELAVVELVTEGHTNIEIGLQLGISHRTVQAHLYTARRKTGTRSRTHLAAHALRSGLVRLDPPPCGC